MGKYPSRKMALNHKNDGHIGSYYEWLGNVFGMSGWGLRRGFWVMGLNPSGLGFR